MSAVTSELSGRADRGRFAAGNTYASGNATNKRMHDLRKVLVDSVAPEKIQAIALKLADMATGGDVQAAKLLLEYTVGRPVQALELTGAGGGPLGLDLARVEVAVLAALEPFGADVRLAVAGALRGAARAGRAGPVEPEA